MKKILFCIMLYLTTSSALALQGAANQGNFLVLSDIHLNMSSTHPMEINPTKENDDNDLDFATYEELINQLEAQIKSRLIDQPNFILILGDIAGHERPNRESVVQNESKVLEILTQHFPHTPILYTFGNNDSLTVNYGPFYSKNAINEMHSPYDIAKTYAGWKNGFLSTGTVCINNNTNYPCINDEDTNFGFYSAYIASGLRLISVNSVLFSKKRRNVDAKDALKQLSWLEQQLNEAEKKDEAVLITMHIPPGRNVYNHNKFWKDENLEQFLQLVKDYKNVIIGILVSHTHNEEWKIIKDKKDHDLAGIYFTPGLSTSHGNAPSVKIFYYALNTNHWFLSNYHTFYFYNNNSGVALESLYEYKNYYCNKENDLDLNYCFPFLTPEKMKKYYTAGNPNYAGIMRSKDDVYLYVKK